MVKLLTVVLAVAIISVVLSKPLEETNDLEQKVHHLWRRFVDPGLASGFYSGNGLSKIRSIRTRRSPDEDCEKLELCRLHARSSRNFLSAFELYFVNKENAQLWDHQTHTVSDCDHRFAHCFGGSAQPQQSNRRQSSESRPKDNYREFRSDDYAQYSDY